jgi:genome maintenance exonuclease 1
MENTTTIGQQLNHNGLRYYVTPNGFSPSVTTVISKTPSINKILGIKAQRRPKRDSENLNLGSSDNGKERGSYIHSLTESYLIDSFEKDAPESILSYWRGLKPVLDRLSDIKFCEQFLYHPSYNYAGTADIVAKLDGLSSIIDLKSSYTLDYEKKIPNWFLQCTAYAACLKRLHNISVEQCAVIVALPGLGARVHTCNRTEMQYYWDIWLKKLEIFHEKFESPVESDFDSEDLEIDLEFD